jgi:Flp pilus assembly protein TadG
MSKRHLLTSLPSNTEGSVAIIFAFAAFVLAGVIGLAIDSSRAVNANSKLQAALDAAALAAARQLEDQSKSDDDLRLIAEQFFDAHVQSIGVNDVVVARPNVIIDRETFTVKVTANATLPSTFGGLAQGTNAIKLKPSAETKYKSKKIEISLVVDVTGSMAGAKLAGLKMAAKDLIASLYAANPNPGAIRVALIPYASSVNAGPYKVAVAGAAGDDPCVVERLGDEQSTDEPPAIGGYLGMSSAAANGNYDCSLTAPIALLTDITNAAGRQDLEDKIDALQEGGFTAGHVGLAWGWYALSPKWAALWPAANRPRPFSEDVIKAVILMTDGSFNTSYGSQNVNSLLLNDKESSADQALETCKEMDKHGKNYNIFTIGFQAPEDALDLLEKCSGKKNFFDATNTGALIDAFREIAERLTSLRLSS